MSQPLAERMRPQTLDDYVGQGHLVGVNAPFRKLIDSHCIHSCIFWGPPGVGKTTLAHIISNTLQIPFYTLNAISGGVREVRDIIDRASSERFFSSQSPILFIDEIHRFSKSQQDSLLSAVEKGVITLIGATTENPSFEVIRPLLSRCQLYVLNPLDEEDLRALLLRAVQTDIVLKSKHVNLKQTEALFQYSSGDARRMLGIVDLLVQTSVGDEIDITDDAVKQVIQHNPVGYDKHGEFHYDIISSFIKSIRGSDPNAAVYWLARMIEGGEDPIFIARRLVISAAEDIGLANPNALLIANAAFDAVSKIGLPEGRIPLSEATIYLAASPKSNSAYKAINNALQKVKETGDLPVPLHLRNAPNSTMKQLGYATGYKYAHDYPDHFVEQQFMPDRLVEQRFWEPCKNASEDKLSERMRRLWNKKYQ